MELDTDIVIAGGGLNGTTLALALSAAGFRVALVEPVSQDVRKDTGFDGRSYALAISSKQVLSVLGIWNDLQDVQPILNIKVTDGRAGEGSSPLMLAFDHAEIEEGPMGFMVEDRHLRPTLLNAVALSDIDELNDVSVVAENPTSSGIAATLSDGRVLRARLLIACDGKKSAIARRAGIKRIGWEYDQSALVAAVAHDRPHNGTAYQFFMPAGPLAILPLTANRSSIVWTEQRRVAEAIHALDDDAYLTELRPRFGDFLGEIKLAGRRFTYPLELSIAANFVAPRIALVGDAAHAVHPIAGQGLNAGLKDVAALAEVLVDANRRGEDIGRADVLARYQQWRRFDAASLALATDTFNRLFSNDNSALRLIRDIGLGVTNAWPRLRRRLIREAAGLTGELPRLARGKAL